MDMIDGVLLLVDAAEGPMAQVLPDFFFFFFFFTLVTGPRRSLSLKLGGTRVYEPEI